MILDTCDSDAKNATHKGQRVFLPRLLDVALQILCLQNIAISTGVGIEMMVLDFAEAFSKIPLHPNERRFFCAMNNISGVTRF